MATEHWHTAALQGVYPQRLVVLSAFKKSREWVSSAPKSALLLATNTINTAYQRTRLQSCEWLCPCCSARVAGLIADNMTKSVRMHSKAWLAASVWLRRSRRLRDTLAAAPGLLAHASITETVQFCPMGPKLRHTTVPARA
jgi:hypothetical protein